jgi:5'-nucleotidase
LKTILAINDDGIYSNGLAVLKRHLDELGGVVVVTPRTETSGVGKAITSTRHVRIDEVKLQDGSKAYAIDGTPADAYLLAVNKVLKHTPDLLVAGINLGPNLGIDDFLNSGTLGATMEAAIHNVPAVAVSYCKQEIDDQIADKSKITSAELELAATVAKKIVGYVLENGLPSGVDLVSVNVPEAADCTKIKVTRLSYIGYDDLFTKEKSGYRIAQWKLSDYRDSDPETDVHVVRDKGCISVTPVRIRFQHDREALTRMARAVAGK